MNFKNRTLLIALLCGLGLGLLVGRLVWGGKAVSAAKKAGDVLTIMVYSNGDLYPRPDAGDIIHWVAPGPKPKSVVPVFAHFVGASPCLEGADTATCTITPNAKGTYRYNCSDQPSPAGGNKLCGDPGIDPNSDVGNTYARTSLQASAASSVAAGVSSPGAGAAATTTASTLTTDLNLLVACVADGSKFKFVGYDEAHPNTPHTSPYTTPNVIKSALFEGSGFTSTAESSDETLCKPVPSQDTNTCTVPDKSGGKSFKVYISDKTASEDCYGLSPFEFDITVNK